MSNNYIEIKGADAHNLQSLDVQIKQDAITCLVGPSGSGKSSLAVETLYKKAKQIFIGSLDSSQQFFWLDQVEHSGALISPVLPTWYLPQYNRVVSSRLRVVDGLNLGSHLAQLFFSQGSFFCRNHNKVYKKNSLRLQMDNFLRSHKPLGTIHFLVEKHEIGDGVTFARSYDVSTHVVRSYNEDDFYVEIYRTKKIDVEKILERLAEFSNTTFYLYAENLDKLVAFTDHNHQLVCEGGEVLHPPADWSGFSPLLAQGACTNCKGHGNLLEYDRRKVIPNRRLSLEKGACSLLSFKRFKKYHNEFLQFCQKEQIDITQPFEDIETQEIWEKIEKGNSDFVGLKKIYTILERKRYKKPYRIFAAKFKSRFSCPVCKGTRIAKSLHDAYISFGNQKIFYIDLLKMSLDETYFLLKKYSLQHGTHLSFLKILHIAQELKIGHLSLSTSLDQLVGSEYQRVLLVKYLSYQGSGNLFILDEPTRGLSLEEQVILAQQLKNLKGQGNTILIVEHSQILQDIADEIIELGPGAGINGGRIIFQGDGHSYSFSSRLSELKPCPLVNEKKEHLLFENIKLHNLNRKLITLPLNELVAIYGSAASGKHHFFNNVILNELSLKLYGEFYSFSDYFVEKVSIPSSVKSFCSFFSQTKSYSSRSTIGTLLGLTPLVRKHYVNLREAQAMNLQEGHFSPNSPLGQCRACGGRGFQSIEMDILQDVSFVCQDCKGRKIVPLYANISDGEQSFFAAVSSPMSVILNRISLSGKLKKIFDYLQALRLDYLSLDRSFNSLSGGEKQRLMLILEITKKQQMGLFFFENISVGLNDNDLYYVVHFLQALVKQQNSVFILDEHPIWKKVANSIINF